MLVSSGARERFEGLIEGEEEFSHHGGEGQFVRFAFGAQTLVKVRQDRVEACGRECSHVEAATQSGAATKDGAFAADRAIGEWNESVLYSFQEGRDGNSPISNLVADGVGNLYGTTSEGGLGSGTIFKLSPIGGGQWMETVVHAFEGPPDGAFAYNGMVVDRFGNFYGATVHGGDNDDGAVYKFTP